MGLLSKLINLVKGEPDAPTTASASGPFRGNPKKTISLVQPHVPTVSPIEVVPAESPVFEPPPVNILSYADNCPKPKSPSVAVSGYLSFASGTHMAVTGSRMWNVSSGVTNIFDAATGQYVPVVSATGQVLRQDLLDTLPPHQRSQLIAFIEGFER